MPVTIHTGYLNVRDDNGEYIRYNTVAEETVQEMVEDIEAKGAEVIDSIPDDYTAFTNHVDDIEDALLETVNTTMSSSAFIQGGYQLANGNIASPAAANRIRLRDDSKITDKTVTKITAASGYSIAVLGWDSNGTYLKLWDGASWDYTSGNVWHDSVDVGGAWRNGAETLSIQVSKGDNHSDSLLPADGVNITTSKYIPTYLEITDQLEAQKVSRTELDLNTNTLEQGGINTTNGKDTEPTNPSHATRVRTGFLYGDYTVKCKQGYVVYGIARYNSDLTFRTYVTSGQASVTVTANGDVTRLVFSKEVNTSSLTPVDLKNSFRLDELNTAVALRTVRGEIDLNTITLAQGGINMTNGQEVDNLTTRVRTGFLYGDYIVNCKDGYVVYGVARYYSDLSFKSFTQSGNASVTIVSDGDVTRIVFSKAVNTASLTPTDLKNAFVLEEQNKRLTELEADKTPTVRFDFDTELRDVSSYVNEMDYEHTSTNPVIEQVYDLFDGLVTNYPNYVSRDDVAEEVDISYPIYANGIETEGTYHVTPAYKTYVYKLTEENNALGNHNSLPKKKLLIIVGIHGDEQAAPFNSYIFAKSLCQGATADYFRLRAAYDVYIIPCVNGYGLYHSTRVNANGVNINRNYPTTNWSQSGEPFDNDYTGPSANSEFETQLVTAYTNLIGFDVAIDHHNYAHQKWQFYGLVPNNVEMKKLIHQSFVDCCIAFIKGLPEQFGSSYKIFYDNSTIGTSPGYISVDAQAHRWWYQQGIAHAATVEISDRINYTNGEPNLNGVQRYSANTFAVNEFTLRNQVLRYCQAALK